MRSANVFIDEELVGDDGVARMRPLAARYLFARANRKKYMFVYFRHGMPLAPNITSGVTFSKQLIDFFLPKSEGFPRFRYALARAIDVNPDSIDEIVQPLAYGELLIPKLKGATPLGFEIYEFFTILPYEGKRTDILAVHPNISLA